MQKKSSTIINLCYFNWCKQIPLAQKNNIQSKDNQSKISSQINFSSECLFAWSIIMHVSETCANHFWIANKGLLENWAELCSFMKTLHFK